MNKPLENIRVVELATYVAAPSCARLLADLGAEVIKIEHPKGDAWRETAINYKPSFYAPDHNPVFDIYNSNKKHIAINLKSAEGVEAMHRLLEKTDIFVTNTRPAALERLGLSYEQLKDKYPALIYAIILGYGEKGPDASQPAFDTTAFWARGGFMRDMADAEHYMPMHAPAGVGDTFTGYLLLAQINAALFRRTRDGKGELVKAGLYHNAVFGMGTMNLITQEPYPSQRPIQRSKSGSYYNGSFCCSDGEWLFFTPGTKSDGERKTAAMVGLEWIFDDPRYSSPADRAANRDELYIMFRDAFKKKPCDYWLGELKKLDFAAVRMVHFGDVCKDEQAWANDYLENVEFADGVPGVMPTCPLEMESVGKVATRPAPAVGHDTSAVLQFLGYTDEQIEQMNASGAAFSEKA